MGKKILQVIGTPNEEDLDWLPKRSPARSFIAKIPPARKQEWSTICPPPKCTRVAHEALDAMLTFHPVRRVNVQQAIELEYFKALHMPDDEPAAEAPVDWAFDRFTPTKRLLQNYIYAECYRFHPNIKE